MSSVVSVPAEEPEHPEPPFSPALVEELLRQLDKTVRAHQLYMHNNPTYLKSVDALRASFAPIWSVADSLTLSVADLKFVWFGLPVHEQHERASDSLPRTVSVSSRWSRGLRGRSSISFSTSSPASARPRRTKTT
jgi:hypothetical protein